MDLFKIDVILNKHYSGLSHTEMLNLPFYEYSLKLKIIDDNEKAEKNKSEGGTTSVDDQISKYQSMAKNTMPNISSLQSMK